MAAAFHQIGILTRIEPKAKQMQFIIYLFDETKKKLISKRFALPADQTCGNLVRWMEYQ